MHCRSSGQEVMSQLAEGQVLLDSDLDKDITNDNCTWPFSKPLQKECMGSHGEEGTSSGLGHQKKKGFIIRGNQIQSSS